MIPWWYFWFSLQVNTYLKRCCCTDRTYTVLKRGDNSYIGVTEISSWKNLQSWAHATVFVAIGHHFKAQKLLYVTLPLKMGQKLHFMLRVTQFSSISYCNALHKIITWFSIPSFLSGIWSCDPGKFMHQWRVRECQQGSEFLNDFAHTVQGIIWPQSLFKDSDRIV